MRKGDTVSFRISDVFLPTTEELFTPFSPDTELEGTIIGLYTKGTAARV